jgi:polyhydroxyalkanoate synthesis repressor PhaR
MNVAAQQKPASKGKGPVVIKKYENRRLYDTSASRYVNLDDIAAMIRNGKAVQVVDAKTREDLTRVTLTQIITEDAKDTPAGLPLELLRQLIVASDQTRQEFIMWYLKSAFDAYSAVQNAVQDRLGAVQSAIISPVESVRRLLTGAAPSPTHAEERSEVEILRKRVAELESQAKKPGAKRKTSGRRKTK